MRNAIVVFVFSVLICSPLRAHDGALALFADPGAAVCTKDLGIYNITNLYLFYVRGEGPYMGRQCRFRIAGSSPNVFCLEPEWIPGLMAQGNIASGISLASTSYLGSGEDLVYLGRIPVINAGDPDTFIVSVVEAPPDSMHMVPPFEGSGLYVTLPCTSAYYDYTCDWDFIYPVCGGTFTFNTPSGYCIPECPVPPRLQRVYVVSPTQAELHFSEPLSEATAENVSNYLIPWMVPIEILGAELAGDGTTVMLSLASGFERNQFYDMLVKDVEDLDGNKHPKSGYREILYQDRYYITGAVTNVDCQTCRSVDLTYFVHNTGARHSTGFCLDAGWTWFAPFGLGQLMRCDTLASETGIGGAGTGYQLHNRRAHRFYDIYFIVNDCEGEEDVKKTYVSVKFLHNVPWINSVTDVPADEGGWVTLAFEGCYSESTIEEPKLPVIRYDVYRLGPPPGNLWEIVGSVPAQGLEEYSVVVPTHADSSPGQPIPYAKYRVRGATEDPARYFESCPDSGYSMGAPPSAPTHFTALQVGDDLLLQWFKNPEPDVSGYKLYRNTDPEIVPPLENLIAEVPDTTFLDEEWFAGSGYCYWLSAVDSAGYESALTRLIPEEMIATLLQSFDVAIDRAGFSVVIRWTLSSVDEGIAYYVMRGEAGAAEFTALDASSVERDELSFRFADAGVEFGKSYRYRVGYLDHGKEVSLFETDAVATPATPLTLYQNVPNPFNPATSITYYLPVAGRVNLDVFDIAGAQIAKLFDGMQNAGLHTVQWNGRDVGGRAVSSGIYFCRLTFGKESIKRKMVLLR